MSPTLASLAVLKLCCFLHIFQWFFFFGKAIYFYVAFYFNNYCCGESSYDQAKYNAREEDAHGRHHQGFCGDNNGNRATDVRRTQIDNTGPDSVWGPYSQNRSRSPPLRRGMIPTDEGGAW